MRDKDSFEVGDVVEVKTAKVGIIKMARVDNETRLRRRSGGGEDGKIVGIDCATRLSVIIGGIKEGVLDLVGFKRFVFELTPEFVIRITGVAGVHGVGVMNKTEGFSLSVDFLASHGGFEGSLGGGNAFVHHGD